MTAKKMRIEELGLDFRGIYIWGHFCNFKIPGFYLGWVSGRVLDFFIKPGFSSSFFKKKNPYSTLFLIRPGTCGSGKNCHP